LAPRTYLAALIIVAVVIGAIGVYFMLPRPSPEKAPVKLRIITRHPSDITMKAKQMFLQSNIAKEYNIVDVEFLDVGPTLWIDVIKSSGEKPGKEIDVAWGGGPTLFDTLLEAGLLSPLNSSLVLEAMNDIPDEISGASMKRIVDNNIMWVAAAISSFGFTINKNFLQEYNLTEPDEWKDLAGVVYGLMLPQYGVGVADPTTSTSNTRMYEIILQAYGWEEGWKIITLMAANSRIFTESGAVRDAVIRGDIGVGITIDFYGYTAQVEKPDTCKYVLPNDGSIVNGDPIALLKTSKHPEEAQAFIAWVLSIEGQKVWLDPDINRLPANPKVFLTEEGKQRQDLYASYNATLESAVIPFSDEEALSYETAMQIFWHTVLGEESMHYKLSTAWKELTKAFVEGRISETEFNNLVDKLTNPLMLEFTDPITGNTVVFTKEYAQSINQKIKSDPEFYTNIVDAWRNAAEKRYNFVINQLASS